MLEDVTLIMPYGLVRHDDLAEVDRTYRAAAREYVLRRWLKLIPRERIVEPSLDWRGQWSKAASIIAGLREAETPYVIMADADVLIEAHLVEGALRTIKRGAPWVVPQSTVRRLTQGGTDAVYAGLTQPAMAPALAPHRAKAGGGLLLAKRATLLRVPPDPRFVGWGQEDESWSRALVTLAGPPVRGSAMLQHLWHPPAVRISRAIGSRASKALYDRYIGAFRDRAAMTALLAEFKGECGL